MKHMKAYLPLLLGIFIFGCPYFVFSEGTSFRKISATIVGFGEVAPTSEEAATETAIESANSHTGSLFIMDRDMVPTFKQKQNSASIHMALGVQFGILVQLNGESDGAIIPVRTRWTHPKFEDGISVEEWPSPMNIGYGRYSGWIIENESEMQPGKWKVEILYKNKVIAQQTFEVK